MDFNKNFRDVKSLLKAERIFKCYAFSNFITCQHKNLFLIQYLIIFSINSKLIFKKNSLSSQKQHICQRFCTSQPKMDSQFHE